MKIDKGIKLPKKKAQGNNIETIEVMDVGDSVYFEGHNDQAHANNFASTGRYHGYDMTMRSMPDGGFRVWFKGKLREKMKPVDNKVIGEIAKQVLDTECPNCESNEVGCFLPTGVFNCNECQHEWKEEEIK